MVPRTERCVEVLTAVMYGFISFVFQHQNACVVSLSFVFHQQNCLFFSYLIFFSGEKSSCGAVLAISRGTVRPL